MKKIYFHSAFLILFILFVFFTHNIQIPSCGLPGCGGPHINFLIRGLSVVVVFLSLLIYAGYLLIKILGKDSVFLKITIYLLMCSYFLIVAAYWWYSFGVYRFIVPQENLKKQQEWQERINNSIRLDPNLPIEVKDSTDSNIVQ